MITRFVKLTFTQEHIEDFIQIWQDSREKIAAFEGCHFVEMHQARVPANVCFTHSIWDSEEALNEAWTLDTHGFEGSLTKGS